jgi:hypothetical protein
MAKSNQPSKKQPGAPTPASVVAQFTLTPPRPRAAAAAAAGSPAPQVYTVLRTNQVDEYDRPVSLAEAAAPVAAPVSDDFQGTARKAAKLSIAAAAVESFNDLKNLIDSLPAEAVMTAHHPPIKTSSSSNRVAEEKRNVKVRAFLYAASREADNDFHLIVGRDPSSPPMYMTMEVSGLPPSSSPSRATLERARDDYKAFFQHQSNGLPGPSYDFYHPPIPVEIEGSLFFDMTHASGGRPGPHDLRDDMPVIWELHPVTGIAFEP